MLWLWIVLIAAALALAAILAAARQSRRKQTVLLDRMRTSAMYGGIHRMLTSCDPMLIEEIIVRTDAIELCELDGRRVRYDFRAHHIDPLKPGNLLTLTHAITVDIPQLLEGRYYTFTHSGRRSDTRWYAYTMKHARKDYLLRCLQRRDL